MSFSVRDYKFWGMYIDEPVTTRAAQLAKLEINSAGGDVAVDLGNPAGTFWTAALADVTYGALATAALSYWNAVLASVDPLGWRGVRSFEIETTKQQVAGAPGAGQWALSGTVIAPVVTFHAAEGIAGLWTIEFEWWLKREMRAVRAPT